MSHLSDDIEDLPLPPKQIKSDSLTRASVVPIDPSKPSVFIKVYGCAHAHSDGEYISGLLRDAGYPLTSSIEDCGIVISYGCTVKNPSEESFLNTCIKGAKLNKLVIGCGCVSQADPNHDKIPPNVALVGVRELNRIVEVADKLRQGEVLKLVPTVAKPLSKAERRKIGKSGDHPGKYDHIKDENVLIPSFVIPPLDPTKAVLPPLECSKIRQNPLIEMLTVSVGCDFACAFCKTRFARGRHQSYPPSAIVERARTVCERDGIKEIWLTGEDVGAYGSDLDRDGGSEGGARWNLPRLVTEICKAIPPHVMIRVGQTNPNHLFVHLADYVDMYRLPNVYKFAHIPVQSGSNTTLKAMRRAYTVEQFRTVVETLRKEIPNITILTDFICGHPGETEEAHKETIALCNEMQFPFMNITQMYPRKGTPAFEMEKIPSATVKARSRELSALMRQANPLEPMRHLRNQPVLFTDIADDGSFLIGHLDNYIKVILRAKEEEEPFSLPQEEDPEKGEKRMKLEVEPQKMRKKKQRGSVIGQDGWDEKESSAGWSEKMAGVDLRTFGVELGQWVNVDIVDLARFCLFGEVTQNVG
ncbi:putative Threonylcarbamoyladenosine tRNA methylthiotransferase MtaB [Blattamonas nauphoetae]|uniref:Threonylcarbamoyladenosine tRNA methylthiotransferase MtaB n=1 Tax=Blattamonas nauphoetae TaxID=2049346 RepID=A0ABQ9XQY1_9EUKA|nr:putative Threonylcarbamoyladenosine tRNA methylthiotransferase MtaB [Blattamonas nauphoetae]